MRRAHFVDPDEPDQWRRFVRTLEAPCKATRAPFMVEDLPDKFSSAARANSMQLVASLLDQSRRGAGRDHRGAARRRRLRQDHARPRDLPRRAIQNAFDDGILWVTLGEQPGDSRATWWI